MAKRFLSLWFRHLTTDYIAIRRPALVDQPFVLAAPDHGRMVITATNRLAEHGGAKPGLAVADARVLMPSLTVIDDNADMANKLLRALALWCIRYTPTVAIDPPNGLILDVSGCAHLWNGELAYLTHIVDTLHSKGYDVRGSIADTIGAAWAVARYHIGSPLVDPGGHAGALLNLPPAALRIEATTVARLQKLGFDKIHRFASMPRQGLRTRFGNNLLLRLDQAFGLADEPIEAVLPAEIYIERLPCLEPIRTAAGIEIALAKLLNTLCGRLQQDGRGLRNAVFKGYRVDGKVIQIGIGTHRATHNTHHVFKLFEEKIPNLEPDLGIEVFTLEAPKVEEVAPSQAAMWGAATGLHANGLSELIDRVTNKTGQESIHRFLPAEHYWPERAMAATTSLDEVAADAWAVTRLRPICIFSRPEPIEVMAPIPDYPPMLFIHNGLRHQVMLAEGPERIEQEWWIAKGEHRDYYAVEDEQGIRFWIFRLGHYKGIKTARWFLHGLFA